MKTDELIDMLVADLRPVTGSVVPRRFGVALVCGTLVSVLAMLAVLGVRPDIRQASHLAMFWIKLGLPLGIAAGALLAAMRLSRPGMPVGVLPVVPAAFLLALWGDAAVVLLQAAPDMRTRMILGESWALCLVAVALLSLPLFAAVMWALKGLAPTRLGLAGAAGGLLAGAIGAAVYSLHCTEMQAPFVGIWYVLGMLAPAVLGVCLGPRLLHW